MSCRLARQTLERKERLQVPMRIAFLTIAGTGRLVSCVSREVTSRGEPLPEPLSREAEERGSRRSKGALGERTGLRRPGEKGLGCGEVGEQSQL